MQGWQGSAKKPGDSPFVPVSQNMGTVVYGDCDDLDAFVKLAREYIYEGNTKTNICAHNAKASLTSCRLCYK